MRYWIWPRRGKIAKAFYDLGYKKTVAFNTAQSDLALLDLPDEHKFFVEHPGGQGAGKNQEEVGKLLKQKVKKFFNKLREIFGENIDRILVCVGAAGGTGGGSVNPLIDIAKRYFTYVGREDANERVGVIVSLPTNGECASSVVAKNAYNKVSEPVFGLQMVILHHLSWLITIKSKKLYPSLTVKKFWPDSKQHSCWGLFTYFNVLSAQNSDYTAFDPMDYDSVMKSQGCMILGVTTVRNVDSETSIANALKANLEKTL